MNRSEDVFELSGSGTVNSFVRVRTSYRNLQ